MNDLVGAFYCIGAMDGRAYQLGECTKSLLEFKGTLDDLIAENERLEERVRELETHLKAEREYSHRLAEPTPVRGSCPGRS